MQETMISTLPTTIHLLIANPRSKLTTINCNYHANDVYNKIIKKDLILQSSNVCSCCGRRHFVNTMTTTLLSSLSSMESSLALENSLSSMEMLNKIHPPKPDWYEELYALVLNSGMKSYEAEIAGYKTELFGQLKGRAKQVLEVGIGTGPNLKYYSGESDLHVIGADPNRKMEKYARGAAVSAGLSPENFEFLHAVGEALPLSDASVDAVIGTLVMCSVKDVNRTLKEIKRVLKPGGMYLFIEHVAAKDGTSLRLLQNILNPLQQLLADGCHLTRDTGTHIVDAGFSSVDVKTTVISNASFINPHLYGVARK